MEVVEALKDISQIEAMKKYLKEHSQRDYLLFVIGINTGLKITELLSMKFEDVLNEDGTVKEFYTLPVKDEKFKQDIYLNTKVKEALLDYVQSIGIKRENYVFQSNKTTNSITRQQAYRVIHNAAEAVGIVGKIGTNSMRKTFGYHHYQQFKDVALLQKIFNHSSQQITLRYIGIEQDQIDYSYSNFVL